MGATSHEDYAVPVSPKNSSFEDGVASNKSSTENLSELKNSEDEFNINTQNKHGTSHDFLPNVLVNNGYSQDSCTFNKLIPNGYVSKRKETNSLTTNGYIPNGYLYKSHEPNGVVANGHVLNGSIYKGNETFETNNHNAIGCFPNGIITSGETNTLKSLRKPIIKENGAVIDIDNNSFSKSLKDGAYYTTSKEYMSSADFGEKSVNCCANKTLMIKTILVGQVLSLMLCGTGTSATALSVKYNVRTPCFNAFLMYTLLASTFGVYVIIKKDFMKIMKKHWWKYFLVALLDVEANYLLTKAYAYTTLTSVQLSDSFTIPTVMVISFIFLRIRYKIIHYAGVIICIAGAVSLVFLDGGDGVDNAPNEVVGDIMALTAAVLYGTSNVGQEYLVKKYSSTQYLGVIGLYGFFLSGLQACIVERNVVNEIHWQWEIGVIIGAFAICQYFYYTLMPLVMKLSSATVVNLSLLTSDLYTLTVGLVLFRYKFSYWYFFAFGGILTGLITYNIKPTPTAPKKEKKKKKKGREGNENITVSKFATLNHIKLKLNGHTPLLISNDKPKNYTRL